jgi:hypothetical protein
MINALLAGCGDWAYVREGESEATPMVPSNVALRLIEQMRCLVWPLVAVDTIQQSSGSAEPWLHLLAPANPIDSWGAH